jgi:hypothetical protein
MLCNPLGIDISFRVHPFEVTVTLLALHVDGHEDMCMLLYVIKSFRHACRDVSRFCHVPQLFTAFSRTGSKSVGYGTYNQDYCTMPRM